MKVLILLAAAVAVCQATNHFGAEWAAFKIRHEKMYMNPNEERARLAIYSQNVQKIQEHNQLYEQGKVTYKMEVNMYADMTGSEFVSTFNGYNKTAQMPGKAKPQGATFVRPANFKAPGQVDWREKGAVTPVKNQGQCGSCWSFSSTGSLEGQYFRKTGRLVSLSEQNLVDCTRNYGNQGCNGGWMDYAYAYIRDNKGIDTESSYPYEGTDNYCRFEPSNVGATDSGFVDINEGDEDSLQDAVASIGPISVAIDASHQSFQFYSEGVYQEPNCNPYNLDHAVLAVGYGNEDGQDYWLIKNSWGTSWGDNGYIKMARNEKNHCGVATKASYPLV